MSSTAKQQAFYSGILAQCVALNDDLRPAAEAAMIAIATMSPDRASAKIAKALETLAALKAAAPAPAPAVKAAPVAVVPDGSYALDGADGKLRFYDVRTPKTGKWAGFTFVDVAASDDRFPIKGSERTRILAEIASDAKAAATRYGLHFSVCACCHKQLTDETSRAIGLGPVCAQRF